MDVGPVSSVSWSLIRVLPCATGLAKTAVAAVTRRHMATRIAFVCMRNRTPCESRPYERGFEPFAANFIPDFVLPNMPGEETSNESGSSAQGTGNVLTGGSVRTPMRRRALGRTGLEVSEIGFGAWAIGGEAPADSHRATKHTYSLYTARETP